MMVSVFIVFALALGQVHFLDAIPGDYFEVFVDYRNTGDQKVKDAQLTLIIPELDVYERSSTMTVDGKDRGTRVMLPYIAHDAQSGWYPMWTILSSDKYRTWKFNWVYVE